MNRTLSVVVPLYNEAGCVEELLCRLHAVLTPLTQQHPYTGYEIVLVDDGSTDATLTTLLASAKNDPHVVVVELARNFGQTAALAAGIDHVQGDVIVTLDGDLQHQPEEIPGLLKKLDEGYDIVSGWREVRRDNPLLRRFPSYCANLLARILTGVSMRDFGSTFKAYRAEVLRRVELFGDLHRFIPVLASRVGARITEIPISVVERKAGVSKYGLRRTSGVFLDLIFLQFYSRYLTRPIRAFGSLFFLFFGGGFIISVSLMLLWVVGIIGAVREREALLLFSVFLMIIGVQFLATGILAELLTRIYIHTSRGRIYTTRAVHRACVEP